MGMSKAVLYMGAFMVTASAIQGGIWPEIRLEPIDRCFMGMLIGTLIVALAMLKMEDDK